MNPCSAPVLAGNRDASLHSARHPQTPVENLAANQNSPEPGVF